MSDRLPCGCERGKHFCQVATTLLREAIDLREKYSETGDSDDWDAYLAIKQKYDEHMERD